MTSKLSGIIPPLVTPFTEDEEVDEAACRADVRYMIEHAGVHGLVVGGSTGEGHTLDHERAAPLVAAVDRRGCRPRAGAGRPHRRQHPPGGASACGRCPVSSVAALQVTPVHYLFRPNDDMMVRHFETIAEAAARSGHDLQRRAVVLSARQRCWCAS